MDLENPFNDEAKESRVIPHNCTFCGRRTSVRSDWQSQSSSVYMSMCYSCLLKDKISAPDVRTIITSQLLNRDSDSADIDHDYRDIISNRDFIK